ncbi:hypothetical protein V8G54_010497 [Vigna mungo]|uniref:Uncharacterized protein n=1 Tax=Vigna mungo TaxID=3915 RepID=A0AAQ3NY47_VIGMU
MKDFRGYAVLCFKEFGDRVKYWLQLKWLCKWKMTPGYCSAWMNSNCTGGDSSTEPYLVTHHQLLAHAAVVRLYKTKYQETLGYFWRFLRTSVISGGFWKPLVFSAVLQKPCQFRRRFSQWFLHLFSRGFAIPEIVLLAANSDHF